MTTVSIYDDIDPIKKETAAPVSLYDELDIPSNTNDVSNTNPNNNTTSPTVPTVTVTSTSTYPPNTNTNTNTDNKTNMIKSQPIIPQIISNPPNTNTNPTQLYNPPPVNDHIDPSLTGVPLQHLATYKSHVLYVGGIQWWVTDADIRRTFDQFGTILDVKIHADKVNGKSKGYGYVEFDTRELEAAVIAKQKLHGHILSDCRISVAFASPERAKGAEYTNTPVHIPRHKMNHPITTTTNTNQTNPNILPKLNVIPTHHPTVMSNHPHNVLAAINNARNTMGNTNNLSILNNSLNNTNSRSHTHNTNMNTQSHRHIRNKNVNTNTNNSNINSNNNNNPPNTTSGNTNPSGNTNTNANTNTIGLLSKFTDQAQLLALLNKTNNVNRSSLSRSITGSRSRSRSPRSRSRSKHSRRRRHGNGRKKSRRHGGDRENRHRNRASGGDIMSGNSTGDRERRKHKRRHRHRDRDRGDREYRERHRERRKRRNNNNNNNNNDESKDGGIDGEGGKIVNVGGDDEIPVTNIAVGGNVTKMNVENVNKKGDEDE